ncbi:MAG: biotin-dependent carboxyltransferase family protein [Bryobacteraceae bacterium]|jgi:antagonist of KipI
MAWMSVVEPGFFPTVQDLGRWGYAHLGVSPCGAADALSLRAGNRLVGNPDSAAALELTLAGGAFLFEEQTVLALTGAEFGVTLNGRSVPSWCAIPAPRGAELRLGHTRGGARAYLCVAGGFQVEWLLGSASTDVRAGFGGVEGRALRRGDRLAIGVPERAPSSASAVELRRYLEGEVLRVTAGPQAHLYAAPALERGAYTVREESNRLGVRLCGEAVAAVARHEMLTEGVSLGAVQVPPDGQPIVLLVDQQTTGGYPKIANVIAADLPRLGQLRPRDRVRFVLTDLEVAHSVLREQEAHLERLLGEAA